MIEFTNSNRLINASVQAFFLLVFRLFKSLVEYMNRLTDKITKIRVKRTDDGIEPANERNSHRE